MLPNFLVIGASKTGTTSLHHYLRQHPQIFLPETKEPGFFAFEGEADQTLEPGHQPFVTELSEYEALYDGVDGETAVGDCSPQYLDHATPRIVARIRKLLPEVRLIAVLRQPVDRAYSMYVMNVREGYEPEPTFEGALARERGLGRDRRRVQTVPYIHGGQRYSELLGHYLEVFERDRIEICLYDDFAADPRGFLRELFLFLRVDPEFEPDVSERLYAGRQYMSRLFLHLLKTPNPLRFLTRRILPARIRIPMRERFATLVSQPRERLDPALRKTLTGEIEPEIEALERLIGRDLGVWRRDGGVPGGEEPGTGIQSATGRAGRARGSRPRHR